MKAIVISVIASIGITALPLGWWNHSIRTERNEVQTTLGVTEDAKGLLEKEKETALQRVATLQSEIGRLNDHITNLECERECNLYEIAELNAEKSRLTGELQIAQAKIVTLTSELAKMQSERDTLASKLEDLESLKSGLDSQLASLQKEHNKLKSDYDELESEIESEMAIILEEQEKTKNEMLEIRTKMAALDKQTKEHKGQLVELKQLCEMHGTTLVKIEHWVTERNAKDHATNELVRGLKAQVQQQDDFQAQIAGHMKIKLPEQSASQETKPTEVVVQQ